MTGHFGTSSPSHRDTMSFSTFSIVLRSAILLRTVSRRNSFAVLLEVKHSEEFALDPDLGAGFSIRLWLEMAVLRGPL